MRDRRLLAFAAALTMLVANVFATVTYAAAQSETVLYSFIGLSNDGNVPEAALVSGATGNLYGTTEVGGAHLKGAIFELAPSANGGWTEGLLHSFSGAGGENPMAGLIFDGAGNLYGTTSSGGSACSLATSCGTVFELSPKAGGGWTEKVLHTFVQNGKDGIIPNAGLILDRKGNLYGTTEQGGAHGLGTVFELTPEAGGGWAESVLHSFDGKDGQNPEAGVIFDTKGDLYGTTGYGGSYGGGTVFELSSQAGGWTESTLHNFDDNTNSTDGSISLSNLIFDSSGNLYGTTFLGGSNLGGTVFELSPAAGGRWRETILHNFVNDGTDGMNPEVGLVFDTAGNLYGTTYNGGAYNYGTVFELAPAEGSWTETTLHSFGNGTDGQNPHASLTFGAGGKLYGTTPNGGVSGVGTVFEITP